MLSYKIKVLVADRQIFCKNLIRVRAREILFFNLPICNGMILDVEVDAHLYNWQSA